MTNDERQCLSALIDRETIDPDVLSRALDNPDGRALLVDFVRLRRALGSDDPEEPWVAPTVVSAGSWRRAFGRAAAALLLVATGVVGSRWLATRDGNERPPRPSRVVEFTPGIDWQPGRP